jgi:hypothetical protein
MLHSFMRKRALAKLESLSCMRARIHTTNTVTSAHGSMSMTRKHEYERARMDVKVLRRE